MTTHLDGVLKREISVAGRPYTVTLTPEGLKLTAKGRRKGLELRWKDLLSGDPALAVALNASLERYPPQPVKPQANEAKKRGARRFRRQARTRRTG